MPLWTNEEYTALQEKHEAERAADYERLQRLCTLVATHMPVKFWGRDEASVWGCVRNAKPLPNMGYCDECPV